MEQIIDLLIGLVIIYSIISPFFKKNSPEKSEDSPPFGKEKPMKKRQKITPPANTRYNDYSEKDILDEIEQLFGRTAKQSAPSEESVIIKEKVYKSESEVYKEEIKDPEKLQAHQEKVSGVFSQKNFNEKYQATKLYSPDEFAVTIIPSLSLREINAKASRLRKLLHSQNSIQDAFLLTEILRKPKAFRR